MQKQNKNTIASIWRCTKKNWELITLAVFFVCFYFCLPSPLFNDVYTTVIEDENGNLIGAKVAADGQWRFPECDSVPYKYATAVVEFEDERFYAHTGFDFIAIARAAWQNIKHKSVRQGGSTITMQLARLMRNGRSRNIYEKIVETILAARIELKYTKDEILALYASHAPFGGNVVGIDAAAWRYFGRSPDKLSWAEAATLAVLPNSPSLIHVAKNRERLLQKRNNLLQKLCEKKYFDAENLRLALAEPLPDKPMPLPMDALHLFNRIEKNNSGQRVRTTLNSDYQRKAAEVVSRYVADYKGNNVNNAAAIIIDIQKNTVVAYIGNASNSTMQTNNGEQVDIINSPRSTGSILKPFLYAAMLDDGLILPNMLVPDFPLHIAGFSPNNYDKTFDGAVPAHRALARSLNVPTVRMLYAYNVEKFYHLLKQLGISTLSKPASHYGLSLILGGAEGKLWDIVSVYSAFARTLNNFRNYSGRYNANDMEQPEFIFSENDKKTHLQNNGIVSAAAIWHTFDALSEVNRPEEEAGWKTFASSRRVAWKTGTSYGNRDAWTVGVTPNYVVGVWVGNASGEGRPKLTGVMYAAPILFDIFNFLPRTSHWFDAPYDEMAKIAVCHQSGYRASPLCPDVDSVWVINSANQTPICPFHRLVHLDASETYRVTSDCYAVSSMHTKSWFVLPPVQEYYYKIRNLDYKSLPPYMPGCNADDSSPIDIIYPVGGSDVVLAKQIDGSIGGVVFQAVHRNKNAEIFWHLDNEFLGTTNTYHQLSATPSEGEHVLVLVDGEGNTRSVKFNVR